MVIQALKTQIRDMEKDAASGVSNLDGNHCPVCSVGPMQFALTVNACSFLSICRVVIRSPLYPYPVGMFIVNDAGFVVW